jgi:uncharacterized protein (TIGR03435 family)
MFRFAFSLSLILFVSFVVFGQSLPKPPAFEVASIKPNAGPFHAIAHYSSSGPRLTLVAYPMVNLVMEAFGLNRFQVDFASSTPEAFLQTYYDVVANAPSGSAPTKQEFRQMLKTLLIERFKLKFHSEIKEMPIYALLVDKDGPKFKESTADAAPGSMRSVNGSNLVLAASKFTMADLAGDLERSYDVDRQIIDRTGLTGLYDIKLEATQEFRIKSSDDPIKNAISIFKAVKDQLGLKLEPQKSMLEFLVVDRFTKPSEN